MALERHDKGEYSYPCIISAGKGKVAVTYTFRRSGIAFREIPL